MEIIFLFVVSAALWTHAWHLLGFYTNPRALGVVGGSVALTLLGAVLFVGDSIIDKEAVEVFPFLADTNLFIGGAGPLSAFVLAWAVYAALVAGVGLWGFDDRTLGFYSLFLALISLLFVAYYFVGDGLLAGSDISPTNAEGGTLSMISWVMGVFAVLLSVASLLLFLYLAPPLRAMRKATGWFFLATAVVGAVFGGLVILGLPLDAF